MSSVFHDRQYLLEMTDDEMRLLRASLDRHAKSLTQKLEHPFEPKTYTEASRLHDERAATWRLLDKIERQKNNRAHQTEKKLIVSASKSR